MTIFRQPYPTRTILLTNEAAQNTAILAIRNAPIDAIKPVEVVVGE